MSLNPIRQNYNHNFTNPNKQNYNPLLVGTVVAIQEVQKMSYSTNPNAPRYPEFWPNGDPIFNIRLALVNQDGQIETFTFQPAGKAAREGKKRSVHIDLFHLTEDTDMMNLIGKTIFIQTKEGQYGQGNPRPWYVGLVEDQGPFEYVGGEIPAEFKAPQVLANAGASGGQLNNQQYGQPPMMQGGYYAPPVPQQPMQPMQQTGYPAGMNPQIAQQMQQMGATNMTEMPAPQQMQPVTGAVYDDIPF